MNFRKFAIKYIPLILIAILIISLAIINAINEFPNSGETLTIFTLKTCVKTLPTLVTLIVQILIVSANRNAFLLGGVNAAIYGVSYILFGLTFNAISAIAISAPIQLISFFTWKNNSNGKRVKFKTMKPLVMMLTMLCFFVGWCICYLIAPIFPDITNRLLDTLTFSIGTVVTVIISLRYLESQYLNIISCIIALVMWIIIAIKDPMSLSYVIISVYNLFRVVQAAINWTKQYLDQKKASADSEALSAAKTE